MSEENRPELELSTTHPELHRAREGFIALLVDDTPLLELGYGPKQRGIVKPVLELITQPGIIERFDPRTTPTLGFYDDDSPTNESVSIKSLPDRQGSQLIGMRDFSPTLGPHSVGAVVASMIEGIQNPIFNDGFEYVAHLVLFNTEVVDTEQLPAVLSAIYRNSTYGATPRGTAQGLEASMLTNLAKKVGLVSTYRADWTDRDTKNEVVVEFKVPGEETVYHHWRRLTRKITDGQGTREAFGRKADSSPQRIADLLNNAAQKAEAGSFTLNPQPE